MAYKSGTGSATAAPSNLYSVREPCEGNDLLSDSDREDCHTLTARYLHFSKRGRPYIQTSIAFNLYLGEEPNSGRSEKASVYYLIPYCNHTQHKNGVIKLWIDASFAIHDDMKSCTGLCIILCKGTIYAASIKQKVNTTSSTEVRLIGVSDGMPKITLTRYSMEAQGHNVEDIYVYQDNQSAILLETLHEICWEEFTTYKNKIFLCN